MQPAKANEQPQSLTDFWFSNPTRWFDSSADNDLHIYSVFRNYQCANRLEQMLYVDQIQRHICRMEHRDYDEKYNVEAIDLAARLLQDDFDPADPHLAAKRVFCLLPFRHSGVLDNCHYARTTVLKWIAETETPHHIDQYYKFYYATIKQLARLTTATLVTYDNPADTFDDLQILDVDCSYVTEYNSNNRPIEPTRPIIPDYLFRYVNKSICVSLSGGVDSMVCLFHAVKQGLDVCAIHINYHNRATADRERRFLQWYCAKLNVPLYVKKIDFISRARDRTREFYEEITNEMRFAAYKQINRVVVLGHNQTDCEENIITNVTNWHSLNNLKGMSQHSVINHVSIYRPMLAIDKSEIYRYANEHLIPYLENSTPTWSARGKIRTSVLPHIPSQTRVGLLALSDYISELHELVKEQVEQLHIETVGRETSFVTTSNTKLFFELMFKRVGIYHCSKKSMQNMLVRFAKGNCRVAIDKWHFITKLDTKYTVTRS